MYHLHELLGSFPCDMYDQQTEVYTQYTESREGQSSVHSYVYVYTCSVFDVTWVHYLLPAWIKMSSKVCRPVVLIPFT